MRITRDMLMKIAGDTVKQRTRSGSDVIAAYLSGSLLGDDYLLGGSADIDLTFIHIQSPQADREIVSISDPVHLDLAHYAQKDFRDTRKLRLHPWMGPTLFYCKPLYDPQHFLDFIQASVRGQFDRPDFILRRSRQQYDHARQMWMSFHTDPSESNSTKDLLRYLRAVEHAVNAVAGLSGMPLTERRLALDFGERTTSLNRPGLLPGLIGLIGGVNAREARDIEQLLPDWHATWLAATRLNDELPARLHPARREYYSKAIEWILKGDHPQAALWPLLRTWSEAAALLSAEHPQQLAWQEAMDGLALRGEGFAERIQALDIYLDAVDETLDAWGRANGV
jgi:hypothetical protein